MFEPIEPYLLLCRLKAYMQYFVGQTNTLYFLWSYQTYGEEPYLRSAEDIAFHVALFIAKKGGSYVNYYMVW